ncbi:MAG: hypothetical protein EXR69_10865 [Myxococcales bacterium]|nr:hypothetical protein [Myxococcales bacterium]
MTLFLLPLSLVSFAEAACTPNDVESAVQEGLLAFAAMDDTGVDDAVEAVDSEVACQTSPLPPGTVAQVHQIHGLAAFLAGDSAGAKAAFSAELAIDPLRTLPLKIAPEGGKLARLHAESIVPVGVRNELGLAVGYQGYVDGVEASRRPADRPAVVQLADREVVGYAAWLLPTSPLPARYVTSAVPLPVAVTAPVLSTAPAPREAKQAPPRSGTAFLIAGGAAAVAAGGLFATSAATHASFENKRTKLDYTINHAGYLGSIGAGAVALGLLTVGIAGSF